MSLAKRNAFLVVLMLALALPAGSLAAKTSISGSYKGASKSLDGSQKYGVAYFVVAKDKLKSFTVTRVDQQCGDRAESMNYGFTVASNVLKAYGLKSKDVKLKKGKLNFTYTQPNHTDKIKVSVKFGKKKASGRVVQTASSSEKNTLNCEGSAKFSMKKK
jgi:hypothetical protein